jgi:hypothetical protein
VTAMPLRQLYCVGLGEIGLFDFVARIFASKPILFLVIAY